MTFQGSMYFFDFDRWRREYDDLTLADQKAFHSLLWRQFPSQHQHSSDSQAAHFFANLPYRPARVLEIGGWTGDAAQRILGDNGPHLVSKWHNVEFCAEAVFASVVTDVRYSAEVPERWVWDAVYPGYNVLYMQHVIEHMRAAQFERLVRGSIPDVDFVFIQSPLDMGPRDWDGYVGCHILEVGWEGVDAIMDGAGYRLDRAWWYPSREEENSRTRTYVRVVSA